jgi:hypothetical protein
VALEHAGAGDALLERPRAEHGAAEGEALAEHRHEVEVAARAGEQADQHDAPPLRRARRGLAEVVAAHEVEHDVGAAASGVLEHGARKLCMLH